MFFVHYCELCCDWNDTYAGLQKASVGNVVCLFERVQWTERIGRMLRRVPDMKLFRISVNKLIDRWWRIDIGSSSSTPASVTYRQTTTRHCNSVTSFLMTSRRTNYGTSGKRKHYLLLMALAAIEAVFWWRRLAVFDGLWLALCSQSWLQIGCKRLTEF